MTGSTAPLKLTMELKKEANRISYEENGKTIGRIDFPESGSGTVKVTHTIVSPEYEGRGIAAGLVNEFAEEMRRQGKKANLMCSYAVAWFRRHPEYEDVLADNDGDR
jgi:predicted GNAT family acetyltransferase